MTPKEKSKKLYDSLKYGIKVKVNGCWENNTPCKINTTLPWESSIEICFIICDEMLQEALSEYTNDENHERVLFWKEVKKELENI